MKKLILVDGNNLLFRSYYATAYTGNIMKNSKGFPTNALYGFVNMLNKIIIEEKPIYMAVAFDVGKNFRTEKYQEYKAGRIEMPGDLKVQFPIAKELLDAMGIKHYELEPYEADDIIGTFVHLAEKDPEFDATIVSSDKDLLQLINFETDVKLLKQKDHIRYNTETFIKDYGIEPIRIIDLKALMGDASDNIPGVLGIGEKTALTLLQKYESIDGIYEHIDEIKGKLQEKLINGKDMAYFSKDLATIYKEVPLNVSLETIIKEEPRIEELREIYEELEFYSFIKNMPEVAVKQEELNYKVIESITEIKDAPSYSFYIECDSTNYHKAKVLGMGVSDGDNNYYVRRELLADVYNQIKYKELFTYDLKKSLKFLDNEINVNYDLMIASYLLEYNTNDDIAYLMNPKGISTLFYDVMYKNKFKNQKELEETIIKKAKFIITTKDDFINELKDNKMIELFTEIEMPLVKVLASMEQEGIKVDSHVLNEMKEEIKVKLEMLSKEIYKATGVDFNIGSPKQLGEILFDKLNLPGGKKTKGGQYKTDVKVLHKLAPFHPIVASIMEYRNLNKLYTTYLEGLGNYIFEDGKIHTIYKQTLTRTGRLSSVEPNMQNIPTKDEEGRKIRKAFLPKNDFFMSVDYSQIELRILAHISKSPELVEVFNSGGDIHTKVAADIFEVNEMAVTKNMRKAAKAVIFGIVYGISGFGLGENLEINPKDAKKFIDKYLELYPDVKIYMDDIVREAYKTGEVRTLFNRRRTIEELKNSNYMIRQGGERIALNTPIQGTSADIIKKAMVEIYAIFKKEKIQSKMLLQVHDELIFDCLKNEKERVTKIVQEVMENTIKLSVPIKVSIEYGANWYEA